MGTSTKWKASWSWEVLKSIATGRERGDYKTEWAIKAYVDPVWSILGIRARKRFYLIITSASLYSITPYFPVYAFENPDVFPASSVASKIIFLPFSDSKYSKVNFPFPSATVCPMGVASPFAYR